MFGQGGVVLYRGPHREGDEPKPMMHEHRKSDIAIVAVKPANKAERSAAELVERRAVTKGNGDQWPTYWTQSHAAGNSTSTRVTTADHMREGAKALDR